MAMSGRDGANWVTAASVLVPASFAAVTRFAFRPREQPSKKSVTTTDAHFIQLFDNDDLLFIMVAKA